MSRQWVSDFLKHPEHIELALKHVEDFDGTGGTVFVRSSGKRSGLGRDLGSTRNQLLVLEVAYADGEKRLELAEVPERDGTQVISVTIP